MQHEYKTEYASSSFYVNGAMTAVVEREGETRRLFSPNDKFARFEDVKHREYKSLKTSGEFYVQDFINVLEADDREKPGSPRNTFTRAPKLSIVGSPSKNLPSDRVPRSSHLAIEAEQLVAPTKMEPRRK